MYPILSSRRNRLTNAMKLPRKTKVHILPNFFTGNYHVDKNGHDSLCYMMVEH